MSRHVRRLLFAVVCLAACGGGVNAQWVRKVSGGGLGNSLCYNPLNLNTVYGSPNTTVLWVSRDKGNTWSQLSTVAGASGITGVCVSVTDSNVILVGQKGSGSDRIMKTTNSGASWTQTWTGTFSYYGVPIEFKPQHPDTVFVMGGTSFYRSTDFGSTWVVVGTTVGFNVWCDCEVNPADANILLIGDNTAGIWKSTNGGVSWTQKYTTGGEIPMISINPFKPNLAYATKWSGGGGFVKSTDYGETWQSVSTFSGQNMWSVSCSAVDPSFVMTCSYSGQNMQFSSDDGATWQVVNSGLGGSGYGALAVDGNGIFALQGDGIYRYNTAPPSAPSAPTLASPANGAVNQNNSPTLTWNASSGATSYRLQLAADSGFTSLLVDDSTIVSTSRSVGPLADTTRWFWHVRAKNSGGSSAFSTRYSFTTGTLAETRTDLVPDGGGYVYSGSNSTHLPRPAYEWIEAGPGTGTLVAGSNTDDFLSPPLTLPQPFVFYGASYTQLKACTNGYLTFDVSDTVAAFTESQIPTGAAPNAMIAPIWDDLRNQTAISSCGIYTRSVGPRFVIEWYKYRRYTPGAETDTLTFQVVLNPVDSTVSVAYASSPNGGFVYGAPASEGSAGIEGSGTPGNGSSDYYHGDMPLNRPSAGVLVKYAPSQILLGPAIPVSVSGLALRDLDGSTGTTGDRSPIANMLVRLGNNGAEIDSATTDAQGAFRFGELSPGTYDIVEDSGKGLVNLEADPGSGGSIQVVSPVRFRITLASGDSSTGNTFVNFEPAMIAGRKLQDFDGDSATTGDRLPLASWKIWRYTETGTLLDSTLTDSLGYFYFRNLPGGDYHLVEDTSGGWIPLPPILGTGGQHTSVVNEVTIDVKFDAGDTTTGSTFVNFYPGLRVLSPSGGEVWHYGSVHDIRWAGISASPLKVECSSDGGSEWTTIAADVPDSVHALAWTVPNSPSSDMLIRVSEEDSGGASAMSSAPFVVRSSLDVQVAAGWNLFSLPVLPPDPRASEVYPTTGSRAYRYTGGYWVVDTLRCGEGFWIKFDSAHTAGVTGAYVGLDTVQVNAKWNMVGGLSVPVPVSSIIEDPPGIVTTAFYEFADKYHAVATLEPGHGYWVKTSAAGRLIMSDAPALARKSAAGARPPAR